MTPADLHTLLLDRLRTIRSITVYDSEVGRIPGEAGFRPPPAETGTGRVYPYVVVWGTAGTPWHERRLTGDTDRLDWNPQLTVAAGTTTWLMQAVPLVRDRLEGARLADRVALRERADTAIPVQTDLDASPPRYFLPIHFTSLIPT